MTHDEAIKYIHNSPERYLQRDKSGKGWICPICGSGSGKKGTGLTTLDGVHFECWRGCFHSLDIIDIIGLKRGIPLDNIHFPERLEAAAQEFNLTLEKGKNTMENYKSVNNNPILNLSYGNNKNNDKNTEKIYDDLTAFFSEAAKHILETDYRRGLSLETLKHFNVGFCGSWRHPKVPTEVPTTPRLIIPTSRYSYIARDTRAEIPQEQEQYKKQKVGGRPHDVIFGQADYFNADKPIFVCEGEIDAMSFYEAGAVAITAGSASNWKDAADFIINNRPSHAVIIAFDTDKAGRENGDKLKAALKAAGINSIDYVPPSGAKDANDALMSDRETFIVSVQEALEQARLIPLEANSEEREAYLKTAAAHQLPDFISEIEKSTTANYFPTGFKELDKILDGGLYAGLYIMGAISSLGKTSLALNISDNIAAAGNDVLIFSLEMAKRELIAKSISRNSFIIARERGDLRLAKTTRGILTGSRYKKYNDAEHEIIQEALKSYRKHAKHIYIHEGVGDIGVRKIRSTVEKHVRLTGNRPVVLIDYLQILAPYSDKLTDKQATDKAVLELKRISRDYEIPVLAISSFNRENYNAPVSMTAFKESGAVEYSSDVLIGLQYNGFDFIDESDAQRTKRVRILLNDVKQAASSGQKVRIQAKILKNRNGSRGDVFLDFVPMFNFFEDSPVDNANNDGWQPISKYGKDKRGLNLFE